MDYDELARDYSFLANPGHGQAAGWSWATTQADGPTNKPHPWFPNQTEGVLEFRLEHDGQVATARAARLRDVAPADWSVGDTALDGTWLLGAVTGPAELSDSVLYLAGQRARILGGTSVMFLLEPGGELFQKLRATPLTLEWEAGLKTCAQTLEYTLNRLARSMPQPLFQELAVKEVGETAETWIKDTLDNAHFFEHFRTGKLSRAQYIYGASQMHQFVRWTTRILGRCVGYADDPQLRSHFLEHLRGEVDHERIIEKDLDHLGHDIEFLTEEMAPNLGTHQFMVAQESMAGFHMDPILLLGSPTAAEGLASHQGAEIIDQYLETVRSWGVERPQRAMKFMTSHVHTDGGDDGHWEAGIAALAHALPNEARLQRFLVMLRTSMDGLRRAYDSYVDDVAILAFEERPA